MGMNVTIASPECYQIKDEVVDLAKSLKTKADSNMKFVNCPLEGAKDADVLYTDVWASMGQEEEAKLRKEKFKDFQINEQVLSQAKKDAIVMHCLPAYKGLEISKEVFEKFAPVIFKEAENRLHAHKGILAALMQS